MKAVIWTEYGPPDVLQIQEIEKPTPQDNDILIKIKATSVNYGDLLARNFKSVTPREFNMPFLFWLLSRLFFGFKNPKMKILGSEFAGEIEATGKNVKRFKTGDAVFGYLGQNMGAYAEYLCVNEDSVVAPKPANMSFEEAGVVPMGSIMAWYLMHKAKIQPGQKVLINGASGSIGSAAVQIAKHLGAEITGVCGTQRLEYVKSLGADHVIDYSTEDFTQNGEQFDLVFDVLGKSSFSRAKNVLSQNGRYLLASFKMKQLFQMLWTSIFGSKRVLCILAPGSTEDLIAVKNLIEAGKFKTIIDKSFPLEQTAEAHRYVETGYQKGKVAITVANSEKN